MRRVMQEEYWAAQNEILWEKMIEEKSNQIEAQANQIATLSNQNATLSNQNAAQSIQIADLRRVLQQAGINIPLSNWQSHTLKW